MICQVIDVPQRSPEWFRARLGRLTSSRAADMLATIKSGEAAARRNLRCQLVLERLTDRSMESDYVSRAMQQGIDREADARAEYEAITGYLLSTSGFLSHPSLMAGCSLDGHLDDYSLIVELKCPTPAIHLEYLRTGQIPGDYQKQIQHALWLTGAEACDWLTFNPDFPTELRTKLVRVIRNDVQIAAYEDKAVAFLDEVAREVLALRTTNNLAGVLREAVAS